MKSIFQGMAGPHDNGNLDGKECVKGTTCTL